MSLLVRKTKSAKEQRPTLESLRDSIFDKTLSAPYHQHTSALNEAVHGFSMLSVRRTQNLRALRQYRSKVNCHNSGQNYRIGIVISIDVIRRKAYIDVIRDIAPLNNLPVQITLPFELLRQQHATEESKELISRSFNISWDILSPLIFYLFKF